MRAIMLASIGLAAWAGSSEAQDAGLTLRDRYWVCVRTASNNDWAVKGQPAMAVEQAFQACATEEQALVAYLSAGAQTQAQFSMAAMTMAALKVRIKTEIIAKMR